MTVLLTPTRRWTCPKCTVESVTHEARPHSQLHTCKTTGLITPMVMEGTKADVRIVEREDYIGNDKVQLHEGRPIMSVVTEREDGQDVAVFAPAASGSGQAGG